MLVWPFLAIQKEIEMMMIRLRCLLLLRVLLLFSCVYSFPFKRGIVDVHNPLRKSTLDCSSLDVVHVNPTEENQFNASDYRDQQRPMATGKQKATKDLFNKEWDFNISLSYFEENDIRRKLSQNDRFVPVIGSSARGQGFFAKRQELFNIGLYPGVEYRVKNILLRTDRDVDESLSDMSIVHFDDSEPHSPMVGRNSSIFLVVRPAYPLIPELERDDWPVSVSMDAIPFCMTRGTYNVLTVALSSALALSLFFTAWVFSNLVTLSVVNTRSMSPAIQPRDIILVEKVTPVAKRLLLGSRVPVAEVGDVVFFREPTNMRRYIKAEGLPAVGNALLVKRVSKVVPASEKMDKNGVASVEQMDNDGVRVCVRGDNAAVSLDSRQFGCFSSDSIVGTPLLRVFPLDRFGLLK